jgi:hypothetical protein
MIQSWILDLVNGVLLGSVSTFLQLSGDTVHGPDRVAVNSPENASSGNTRRSTFLRLALMSTASARLRLFWTSPGWAVNFAQLEQGIWVRCVCVPEYKRPSLLAKWTLNAKLQNT